MKNNNKKESNEELYATLLEQINGDLVEHKDFQPEITRLCKLGLMKRGMDSDNKERFSVTDLGKEQLQFMCVQDSLEEAMDGIIQFMA